MPHATDRNLLFGVLAMQAGLIDSEQLGKACALWAAQRDRHVSDVLIEQSWLTPADVDLIETLLQRTLQKHEGDVQASLADIATPATCQALREVADPAIRNGLHGMAEASTIAPSGAGDPALPATLPYQPEARQHYTLTRLHARGGIGQVWLARDEALGREVALKEILPERADHPAVMARFLEEARIAAQLQHPGIIPVYELSPGSAERPAFYTMKFIRGRTLADACKQYHQRRAAGKAGPLELRELLSAFVTVCQAVGYAHSRAVIHRDLKPANVALGDYGEVLVLDFGLSKLMGETPEPPGPNGQPASLLPVSLPASEARGQTIHGQALGTPSYMAPEQAEGRIEQIDARSDIYGLGAILYEVLTGQAPFTGPDTGAILAQVVCDPPVPPRRRVPAIPRALEAICLKALAKQRTQRYASASELAAEVQRFLADEPVQAFPEPWTMKTRRWLGRHRTAVATATATLLVATVGLAIGAVLLAAAGERARAAKLNAERQQNRAKRLAYMTGILAVERARDEGNLARARSLIQELPTEADTQDLRDFEWHYLRRLCDEAPLWAADLHPSAVETETGQEVLSLQGDGAGIIALSGPSLAFSPDGRCLAMSTGTGPIELWETARPTSVGEQRAANALVANLFGTIPRRTAVLQQLRAMPLLDTSIRQQALAAAQAYPEDAEHLDILAWNIVQAPDRPAS